MDHETEAGDGVADGLARPATAAEAVERLRASAQASPGQGIAFGGRLGPRLAGAAAALEGRSTASVVALAVVLVAAGAGGLLWWWRSAAPPAPVAFVPTTAPTLGGAITPAPGVGASGTTTPAEVVVHAAGAVATPGVYRLSPASRVGDLLAAAGGLAPGADPDQLNLASPLADGTRVYVPRRGEEAPPPAMAADGAGPAGSPSPPGPGSSPVDLNAATADALDALPGVGPVTAAAIVEHRQRNGRFTAVDDLLDVAGIGPAKLEQLRPLVRV